MKIIYITSIGYSGSTLLDRLLETTPNSFSVGEVDRLVQACKANEKTQTGHRISNSPVWGDFCEQLELYVVTEVNTQTTWKKYFAWILPWFCGQTNQYKNGKLFRDIHEKAEEVRGEPIENIIDLSKDPLRMISLHRHSELNIKVIHLIRSPWGVVNSNISHNKGWVMGCIRWIRTNIAIWWYTFWFVGNDDYIRVHYEDIAKKPRGLISNIDQKFSTGQLPDNFLEIINNRKSYRFGGNTMMRKEVKEIRYDDKWKDGLSLFQKIVVGIICGPLYALFLFRKKIT